MDRKTLIVVMGVSGSGKSTVGQLLAQDIGAPFLEGDDFHPAENVAKMSAGHALTDEDRREWVRRMSAGLATEADAPIVVLACSALTPYVRGALGEGTARRIEWVVLDVAEDELRQRMQSRAHFMPVSLLESQLAALSVPDGAVRIAVTGQPSAIVSTIRDRLGV